jgi:sulfatase modifying factor 1
VALRGALVPLSRVARPGLALALLATACGAPEATWIEPATGLEFVLLPAAEFAMGSPATEAGHEASEKLHRVRLTHPVWFGRYEVTQGQWLRVMGANPSRFEGCGLDCPVENVDAFEVEEFLVRLGKLTGATFRLPTEAEWEYACRAGTATPFSTGANLTSAQANYDGRYPYPGFPAGSFVGRPTPVGSYPANAWGLFDLHGNVWEWCQDELCPYPDGTASDPVGSCASELRIIRGGSWTFNGDSARCAVRYSHRPQHRGPSLGVRVVREVRGGPLQRGRR